MHALARLAHRGVAEADDRERRQAGAQVDLDGDAARVEAVDREGGDAGEHDGDATAPRVTADTTRSYQFCGGADCDRHSPAKSGTIAVLQCRCCARLACAGMPRDLRQHLGRLGEDLALEHLERLGFTCSRATTARASASST